MNISGTDSSAEVWAGLLARSCNPVLRVPDLRPGLRWWRAAAGARIIVRGRLGDLRIAVLDLERFGGLVVVMVGGPGALEATLSPGEISAGDDTERAVDDPWGNTLVMPPARRATGVAA